MKYQTGCLVCGQELVYLDPVQPLTCVYCGQVFEANARCVQDHFVCDACHRADANDLIESYCLQAAGRDPVEMAITLMNHPSVAMHGPEHHFLVPAVLLAAYDNTHPGQNRAVQIKQARKRAEGVRGGSCGFCGNCGAAVGTGIFISLITGASPLSKKEWQLANRMTAESLLAVAEVGGPRCCKRDTFLALQSAQAFLKERLDVALEVTAPIRCDFSPLNRECLKEACPFFAG
jgi:hypothetical protein